MEPELEKQFSREELVAMGEIEPETTKTGPETQESDASQAEEAKTEQQTPEQAQKAEAEGETQLKAEEAEPEPEEGQAVPYERFSKIYGKAKQTEREKAELQEKLDLFKSNQAEYYAKYPDEKPDDWQQPTSTAPTQAAKPEKVHTFREMLGARVNDPPNAEFHGKTLAELMHMGPEGIAAAQDYYNGYVQSVQETVRQAKSKEEALLSKMREEDNRFLSDRANEMFGKPVDEISPEQKTKVESVMKETLAWMKKNNRLAYSVEDAFKIMNYEKALRDAESRGAKNLVDYTVKGTVQSVNSSPPADKSSDPYAKWMGMTEDQLVTMIAGMPDVKYSEFLERATPAFRQKFPNLPYLN